MSEQYYSSNLLDDKSKLEIYFESIIESVKKISNVSISNDWKCEGNNDVKKKLTELKRLNTNINLCLGSYKDILSTVDTTYSNKSDEISEALKGIDLNS